MSDKYAALKQAAEKAGGDVWQAKQISGDAYVIRKGSYQSKGGFRTYQPIAEIDHKPVRDFVAAANPATILELLAERDADRARIAELEKWVRGVEESMISASDRAESAEKRVAELEARETKPAQGEVLVTVTGYTGCGKSAIAGEIEIAMKAIGVPVEWTNGDAEKRMTGADWLTAIEMYKPRVRILEVNQPRSAGISVKIEGE